MTINSVLIALSNWLLMIAAADQLPEVPKELKIEGKVVARLEAKGVQVYKSAKGPTGELQWDLQGPIAELFDSTGQKVGYHYDGPTWEAVDGSKISRDPRKTVLSAPAPQADRDIPWLRVEVIPAKDIVGKFDKVTDIQRVATQGGKMPSVLPRRVDTKVAVPYSATYIFWTR